MKTKTKNKLDKEEFNDILHDLLFDFNSHVEIVRVSWEDANTNRDSLWMKDIPEQKLLPVETIGYLLYENEKIMVIGGFWFWDSETDILDPKGQSVFKDVHTIPKSQIKSVIFLKTDWERSKEYRKEKNEKTKS